MCVAWPEISFASFHIVCYFSVRRIQAERRFHMMRSYMPHNIFTNTFAFSLFGSTFSIPNVFFNRQKEERRNSLKETRNKNRKNTSGVFVIMSEQQKMPFFSDSSLRTSFAHSCLDSSIALFLCCCHLYRCSCRRKVFFRILAEILEMFSTLSD